MSGIEVLSRTQRIIVLPHTSVSMVKLGPAGPPGPQGPAGIAGPRGVDGDTVALNAYIPINGLPVIVHTSLDFTTAPTINGQTLESLYALLTDIRFTDARVPTDGSVTNVKVAAGADIEQAKIANLVTDLAARSTDSLVVHLAGTELITGLKTFQSESAATVGVIVKGVVSQTADLQEWQDSAGVVLTKVAASGKATVTVPVGGNEVVLGNETPNAPALQIKGFFVDTGGITVLNHNTGQIQAIIGGNSGIIAQSRHLSIVGAIVKGLTGQTADLQQWQDSAGTVLAKVDAAGNIVSPGTVQGGVVVADAGSGVITGVVQPLTAGPYLSLSAAGIVALNTSNVANVPLTVRGMVAQTGDLQQWQNSNGTTVASISSVGRISSRPFNGGSNPISASGFFEAGSTTSLSLVARGIASQTANLQEWQNSAGTTLASISSAGYFSAPIVSVTNADALYLTAGYSRILSSNALTILTINANTDINLLPTRNVVITPLAANVGLIVKGAASQTADLQRWQDSVGTVIAKVEAAGQGHFATMQLRSSGYLSAALSVVPVGATERGIAIRGFASQTADLQQWQNSAGTMLTRVDSVSRIEVQPAGGGRISTSIDAALGVSPRLSGAVGVVVRGLASQVGDLQQWQNSAGTVIATVSSVGFLNAAKLLLAVPQNTSGGVVINEAGGNQVVITSSHVGTGLPFVGTFSATALTIGTSAATAISISSGGAITIPSSDIEYVTIGKGPIIKSPDGTRYRVTVGNDGALITAVA